MAEWPKLLYVIVHDELLEGSRNGGQDWSSKKRFASSRYTRAALQSTIQFMGCKPRHAFKISVRVFDVLRNEPPSKVFEYHGYPTEQEATCWDDGSVLKTTEPSKLDSRRKASKPNKKRSMVIISREKFIDVVCNALAQYQYVGSSQRADFMLACRLRERKTSVTVLLCGTSGCGKSTLSSLLASRLGITTVVSTDSIRHMMRSFVDEKTNPLLWASTYHAGEYLDPVAVKEATLKKKATKVANNGIETPPKEYPQLRERNSSQEQEGAEGVGWKTMVVQGFKAQCEMVIDSLDRLITSWEQKNQSVVIEGVHLSLNFVMGLMRKHPSIVPFMIYISNEEKHLERFAVRAKYMTLDPSKNKYAKYIRNIRTIQEYLCKRADKHLVPKVNNTNVDKSVASIHATIFSCLRRREAGEALYDQSTNTVKLIDHEYQHQYAASALGSKCMFQLIQRKGSSRHLMALMNNDGSVARAWPIGSLDGDGRMYVGDSNREGRPMYGPMQISKAELVNLHFGNFGLSSFSSGTGETSSSSSGGDGQSSSRGGDEHQATTSSSHSSLCSSSPRHAECGEKEAVDEAPVFVNEEDVEEDDNPCADSDDEELAFDDEHIQNDEMEGSVSESSMRSDEESEFIGGLNENDGYWSEDQELDNKMIFNKNNNNRVLTAQKSCTEEQLRRTMEDVVGGEHVNEYSSSSLLRCAKRLHNRTKSLPVLRSHRSATSTATEGIGVTTPSMTKV